MISLPFPETNSSSDRHCNFFLPYFLLLISIIIRHRFSPPSILMTVGLPHSSGDCFTPRRDMRGLFPRRHSVSDGRVLSICRISFLCPKDFLRILIFPQQYFCRECPAPGVKVQGTHRAPAVYLRSG